jgi:FkbM family methyltransferase
VLQDVRVPSRLGDRVRAAKLDFELRASWRRRLSRGEPTIRLVESVVRAGDVVLDIGASWGHYTASMARLAGRGGTVHAFEPNPANWRQLGLIALRHPNVVLHRRGLSNEASAASLYVPVRDGSPVTELGSVSRGAPDTVSIAVELARLDDVLPVGIDVAFVKCDVEGHERSVLAGGAELLERSKPALLIELERRHAGADVRGTIAWLEGLGYVAYMVDQHGLTPADRFDEAVHQPEDSASSGYVGDFFFVADDVSAWRFAAANKTSRGRPTARPGPTNG